MSEKIKKLLENRGENYIFPFFWLRGESEEVLRKYMGVIDESNIKAVCVESRPHPDFCGEQWWQDMDIILEEAKKRNMKVWILDDSHFPTGFANGAMKEEPDFLCRQSICIRTYALKSGEKIQIGKEELTHPTVDEPTEVEKMIGERNPRKFTDDRCIGVYAVNTEDSSEEGVQQIDLSDCIEKGELEFSAPEGNWRLHIIQLSRNKGIHRSYINMMNHSSCKVLLDAVYEPHYAHYKEEFGKTIAGFFSDEPELGNGHLFEQGNVFGRPGDYPWSEELAEELQKSLGEDYVRYMPYLWEESANAQLKAKARYAYMDAVSKLVKKDFSYQMGEWCRTHGVEYIGHLIEDNNQHARTGSSLGHYFRGLAGQDMAGIDDIGGQVLPQEEEIDRDAGVFNRRIGEFYHYMLGKLASSAAAIEPLKKGNSMCEIFGAYGWQEGVQLEKYLVDHFMVRGVNHYVPHAFSAKEFPDPDCPPHFYAHGNNPQYRHFGKLMAYTNRVCELISGGSHVAPIALLYHGEGEWTGACMMTHKVAHPLYDNQIDYDIIPQDVFAEREEYQTEITAGTFRLNTQSYRAVIVPAMEFVTPVFAEAVKELADAGIPVYFVDRMPKILGQSERMVATRNGVEQVALADLVSVLQKAEICEHSIEPANDRIRIYHYEHKDGSAVYLFVNEGTECYQGKVSLAEKRKCYIYDAWENQIQRTDAADGTLQVEIHPRKSLIVVFEEGEVSESYCEPVKALEKQIVFAAPFTRSICRSIQYPAFEKEKEVTLPDHLVEEEPAFSGFVRYENKFLAEEGKRIVLEITDAAEGVEVFVNDRSMGIQIVPPYLFDLSKGVKEGENMLRIEVATTLNREMSVLPGPFGEKVEATALSGITGDVRLYIGK